ncbi:MAG: ABC-2 family transporter protein [Candidatus Doudnabacteria bacterium]|nr:ABC-2 family transporter protein [Candidatus Doudnabacteria bacterium]
MTRLRIYLRIVKMHLMYDSVYRGRMFVYALMSFLYTVIFLAIWLSVVGGGELEGFTQRTFVTYFIGVFLISKMVFAYGLVELGGTIRRGELSKFLVKPVAFMRQYAVGEHATHVTQVLLAIPVILIALALYWGKFQGPSSIAGLGVMAIAILCASLLMQSIAHIIGMIAFWLEDTKGVIAMYFAADMFLSGHVAPLALLPDWLERLSLYLPFRYFASFPMEIYLGQVSTDEIALGFGILFGWLVIMHLLSRLVWARGIRRYTAVGM